MLGHFFVLAGEALREILQASGDELSTGLNLFIGGLAKPREKVERYCESTLCKVIKPSALDIAISWYLKLIMINLGILIMSWEGAELQD